MGATVQKPSPISMKYKVCICLYNDILNYADWSTCAHKQKVKRGKIKLIEITLQIIAYLHEPQIYD